MLALRQPLLALAAAAMLTGPALVASAEVIYREKFNTTGTGNFAFPYAGWDLRSGGTAVTVGASGNTNAAVSGDVNAPNDGVSVNNNPDPAATHDGRVYYFTNQSHSALLYTDEYVIDTSLWAIDSFQWYGNENNNSSNVRIAVRVDGNWYVTGQVVTTNSGVNVWTQRTLGFDAEDWRQITFVPGTTLTQNGAISSTAIELPEGNITAFGLYLTPTNGVISRYDEFTINATLIPEPASLALIGLGTLLILPRRRMGCDGVVGTT